MSDLRREVRILKIYCAVITIAAAVLVLAAFQTAPARQRFQQIDVERINVVEPNGKLDLVISNKALSPDPIVGGKTLKRSGDATPGMLFYNGEGDEDGGLSFDSNVRKDGYDAGAALLFDQYHQDQTVGIMYEEKDHKRNAGFYVWDRPDTSVAELYPKYKELEGSQGAQREALIQKMRAAGELGALRGFMGKNSAGDVMLRLADSEGHNRLVIGVNKEGKPKIEFLDEKGTVTYSIAPPAAKH